MAELTEDMAQTMRRAAQILAGLARVASRDCSWQRNNSDLHAEILELQDQLRQAAILPDAATSADLTEHLLEAHVAGDRLRALFQAQEQQESGTDGLHLAAS